MRFAPAFMITILLLLAGATAYAEGRVVYRLAYSFPPTEAADQERVAASFGDLVVERLRDRLKAADIKEFEVRRAEGRTLFVETGWDHPRPWMAALLTSPGNVEVRPVVEGPDWLTFAASLPEGVELKGHPAYLWSAQRKPLESFLSRMALPNRIVELTLDDGGFRTVSLGTAVATAADVKSASWQQARLGNPFVSVTFATAVGGRLAQLGFSGLQKVAIILDGEVIGFVPAKAFTDTQRVRIGVPHGAVANTRSARELWARQVAGRLAGRLPIPIAILKE